MEGLAPVNDITDRLIHEAAFLRVEGYHSVAETMETAATTIVDLRIKAIIESDSPLTSWTDGPAEFAAHMRRINFPQERDSRFPQREGGVISATTDWPALRRKACYVGMILLGVGIACGWFI
jgi:hypothetical protein